MSPSSRKSSAETSAGAIREAMTASDSTEHAAGPDKVLSPLSADKIRDGIRGGIWEKVFLFESVDSTNERALALPASELSEQGTVIIAESQTEGRGRLGRRWVSPAGRNIYLSAVLRPAISPKDATLLTVAAALAGAVALRNRTALGVRIKWPNDLMVNGRKIGGILTELRSGRGRISRAVIGIGVNVNSETTDFPADLRESVTSVRAETGMIFSRTGIITEILNELAGRYKMLVNEGRSPLLAEWKRLSSTIGKEVRVVLGEEIITGTAETIDDEGMLILRVTSGDTRKVSAGDVKELQ
jgi:BirA family biotin operon repressor/biotin-[acetyl-CoA-carboxylase] ligase